MSGRRLVNTIERTLAENGVTNATVLVMSLSNGYSAYVTTEEEYSVSFHRTARNPAQFYYMH